MALTPIGSIEPLPEAPPMTEVNPLADLMAVIASRKENPQAEKSYVASLLAGGVPKVGAKVIEEAAEVVEAAGEPGESGREHLVKEVADLVFHAMVMLACRDAVWSDVEDELARRFGVSGLVEKQRRRGGNSGPEVAPRNPSPTGQ